MNFQLLLIKTIIFLLIISNSRSFAQYTEIKNKRDEMVSLIQEERFDEISFSSKYETKWSKLTETYHNLLIMEHEVLNILKGNYHEAVELIIYNEYEYFSRRNNRTYLIGDRFIEPPFKFSEQSFGDTFNSELLKYLDQNNHRIKQEILASDMTDMNKMFLIYYIDLSIYYKDKCIGLEQERAIKSAEDIVKKHPNSKAAHIAKKYSNTHYKTSKWGREVSFIPYGKYSTLNADAKKYTDGINSFIGIGYGWNFGNIFIKGNASVASMELKKEVFNDYYVKSFNSQNNNFTGGNYQLYAGYSFHIGDQFTISPYIGKTWTSLGRKLAPKIPSNDSLYVKMDMTDYMIGVTFDLNFQNKRLCNDPIRKSRGYHRLNIGLTRTDASISTHRFGSPMLFFQYSIGFHANRTRGVTRF